MAKSIAFHYSQIIDLKSTQSQLKNQLEPLGNSSVENLSTLLAELNSSSKVAIWRLWAWITATIAWTTDVSFDVKREELQYIADTALVGNDNWLVDVAKDFRFNTTTNNMVPLVIDLVSKASVYASPTLGSNEIKPIAVATVIKSNAGFTNLLVAKSLGATFQKLNINELNAFRNYITQYKQFTGTNIQVSSQDSDVMAYNLQIRFDFTKGTPNPELTIKTAIETACRNIGFNGKLERLVLEDAIQKVPGVLGIVGDYKAKDFTASEFIFFQDYYQTVSGYINLSTNNADLIMVLTPNE